MKEYNMNENRLNYYLRDQRDNWKERALTTQKEKRTLEGKVAYTSQSRDKWKDKAKKAQAELQELKAILKQKEAEIEHLKKNPRPTQTLAL